MEDRGEDQLLEFRVKNIEEATSELKVSPFPESMDQPTAVVGGAQNASTANAAKAGSKEVLQKSKIGHPGQMHRRKLQRRRVRKFRISDKGENGDENFQ